MEFCEGLFKTRVPAEQVVIHLRAGGNVVYKRYVFALTMERYPAQASNKVARLIGVSEDEMSLVHLDRVVCEPGKGHQHWRFRTHNFMVADWEKAPKDRKACFSIEIPVALT